MASSGQKFLEDSSPIYLPDWEVPPDSTGQRLQIGGGFSVGKRFKFLKAVMPNTAILQPAASVHNNAQGNPVQPVQPPVAPPPAPPRDNKDHANSSTKCPILRGTQGRRNRIIALLLFCVALVAIALGVGLGLGLRYEFLT